MAKEISAHQEYKQKSGTTPLPTFIATDLFLITKGLAEAQEITHAKWIRDAIVVAVNAQGIEYVYPEKLSLLEENNRLKAMIAALQKPAPDKKVLVPTAPGVKANPETGELEEVDEDEGEEIEED